MSGFFAVHKGLPREGPGSEADVARVAASVGQVSRLCDAGCGPGGDLAALRTAFPKVRISAVDAHAPFVGTVRDAHPDVDVRVGDLRDLGGPYDLIWSAGAVYIVGIAAALQAWRGALAPGGHVAFSHPVFFSDDPSDEARAFWGGYQAQPVAAVLDAVAAAGWWVRDQWPVGPEGWEAYYGPLEARAKELIGATDSRTMRTAARLALEEATAWRRHADETGYLFILAAPV
ncbi:class I SAM-dependent methyltransferase [Wenxinia marina]|uniref:Methyltransferase domain protein n=1 Tax=Wenxinia marina DSM 24838 TaxID=1123501 RepID=A0A0D0Q9W1_9RHOB|nr:class I SAM-dependent methyltransferase [Wenxinia marina]KIQ67803.1 Methyltransferase domain protein [Wenxinia marina DSM 24838]GGL74914.1 ubiquinone/menaquinone biosynthesis methyltransferase [Wenxinia marina]